MQNISTTTISPLTSAAANRFQVYNISQSIGSSSATTPTPTSDSNLQHTSCTIPHSLEQQQPYNVLPQIVEIQPPTQSLYPMVTRSRVGIFKPKAFTATVEPLTVLQEEHQTLLKNNTWELVQLPLGKTLIGCKWVFKLKENLDGSINKYKAQLVAKGYDQQPGLDFSQTFSLVVKPTTIRVVLTVALANNWKISQLEFNNAFLNGTLNEEFYMIQPPGFE